MKRVFLSKIFILSVLLVFLSSQIIFAGTSKPKKVYDLASGSSSFSISFQNYVYSNYLYTKSNSITGQARLHIKNSSLIEVQFITKSGDILDDDVIYPTNGYINYGFVTTDEGVYIKFISPNKTKITADGYVY